MREKVCINSYSTSFIILTSLVKEREEFLKWLSDEDFERIHEDKYARKHPGTGNWLIQKESFRDWFDSDRSTLLWCHGKRKF